MIWIAFAGITLMFMGVSFVYGFYYGSALTVKEYELSRHHIFETQAKCRLESKDFEAIADITATSALVERLDSTGAKTIITMNHN